MLFILKANQTWILMPIENRKIAFLSMMLSQCCRFHEVLSPFPNQHCVLRYLKDLISNRRLNCWYNSIFSNQLLQMNIFNVMRLFYIHFFLIYRYYIQNSLSICWIFWSVLWPTTFFIQINRSISHNS